MPFQILLWALQEVSPLLYVLIYRRYITIVATIRRKCERDKKSLDGALTGDCL
jgi:hypothetical protein